MNVRGRVFGAVLAVLAALAVLTVPVVFRPGSASAAPPPNRRCQEPGQPNREPPWHQASFDPQRAAALSTGSGVTVAVIDSGVDASHPQLAGRVLPGQDLLHPGGGPGNYDCVGHGTAVASIIAGGGEPGAEFRGYAPGVQILPFVVSEQGSEKGEGQAGTAEGFAKALQAAVAQGADVVNLSLALYEDVPTVRAAVRQAIASDVVVVAAAGNVDTNAPPRVPYPAAYPDVIGVGAVDRTGVRVPSSAVGPWVDLMAPGDQVVAATRVTGYAPQSGTSFAAPFVSAAAALVRSREPQLSAKGVAARLFATAGPALGGRVGGSAGPEYGRGIVDPYRAAAEYPGGAEAARPQPLPVFTGAERDPVRTRQVTVAVTTGVAVVLVATLASAAGAAVARGRRRRWRPARAARPTDRVPADGNRRLFDDLEED